MTDEALVAALRRVRTLIKRYSEESTWRAMAAGWGDGQREWLLELNELRTLCFRHQCLWRVHEALPLGTVDRLYGYREDAVGSLYQPPRYPLAESEIELLVKGFTLLCGLFESPAEQQEQAAGEVGHIESPAGLDGPLLPADSVKLTLNEAEVLSQLLKSDPVRVSTADVVNRLSHALSPRSVQNIWNAFRERGWIDDSAGPRSGYALTADGCRQAQLLKQRE